MIEVGIIDYGMGNLNSVQKSVERHNVHCALITKPEEVLKAEKLILPGVGAFEDAIRFLKASGLVEPMIERIKAGTPFLGICLGMQMLFDKSWENGEFEGLGLFHGEVKRFQFTEAQREAAGEKLSIPHMGWNQVTVEQPEHPFWKGIEPGTHFYFVHSYHVVPIGPAYVAAKTVYGYEFCSAVTRDNLVATQFHPEKSQGNGARLLENFVKRM